MGKRVSEWMWVTFFTIFSSGQGDPFYPGLHGSSAERHIIKDVLISHEKFNVIYFLLLKLCNFLTSTIKQCVCSLNDEGLMKPRLRKLGEGIRYSLPTDVALVTYSLFTPQTCCSGNVFVIHSPNMLLW